MNSVIELLRGGIIVSCQAVPDDPTYGPAFMVAFALAAQRGGAVGIRANGPDDVAAIKAATTLPVIGIWKRPCPDGQGIIITPSLDDAIRLKDAGADIIAGEVSDRPRPGGIDAATLIKSIDREVGLPFMADCGTLAEALMSQEMGAAIAATTRAHPSNLGLYEPDLDLLRAMTRTLHIPVIAEGRFWNPDDVREAFASGAHAVVIGSAVTRPWLITERYVAASQSASKRG
jgi:N-acylglucosamine-6-phosphate 2-epimerase